MNFLAGLTALILGGSMILLFYLIAAFGGSAVLALIVWGVLRLAGVASANYWVVFLWTFVVVAVFSFLAGLANGSAR